MEEQISTSLAFFSHNFNFCKDCNRKKQKQKQYDKSVKSRPEKKKEKSQKQIIVKALVRKRKHMS